MDTHDLVKRQFGPAAQAYATSASHANKDALDALVELVRAGPEDVALDVATGPGNLALALAPHVKRVVASDLTQEMVEEAARRAELAGYQNFEALYAAAEDLPFADGEFTLVTVRVAPHHFADIRQSIAEMARVLAPGGRLLVVDTIAPEDGDMDRDLNSIEAIRDPSHVRNYKASEWRSMIEEAGLTIEHFELGYYDAPNLMDFDDWLRRQNTPPGEAEELRRRMLEASPAFRELLKVKVEGEKIFFTLPQVTLVARKGRSD